MAEFDENWSMRSPSILAVFLLGVLCGCQSFRSQTLPSQSTNASASEKSNINLPIRNNALALLDDLLNDEKNVSKILLIKHNSDELGKLIKEISTTAGQGAKMLDEFPKKEPGLDLKRLDLPPGEAATRKGISKTKEHLLLSSKDAEFEFQLLLTQSEALNYGAHLAMVAADCETQPERVREFLRLSAQLRDLHERVLARLRKQSQ
jgi:hypothetical protein